MSSERESSHVVALATSATVGGRLYGVFCTPTMHTTPARRIAILGIDTLARKNRPQLDCLLEHGFAVDVFTSDARGDSAAHAPAGVAVHVLARGGLARVRQVATYLRRERGRLHHVEVYPGGRFAAFYVAAARAARVRVLVVERGDLIGWEHAGTLLRLSMHASYRLAHAVWYREPYQDALLQRLGARRRFMLPNVIAPPPTVEPHRPRDIDFLWVNRVIPERRADWFVRAMADGALRGSRAVLLGMLPEEGLPPAAAQMQGAARGLAGDNVTLLPFGDPEQWFARARFFVLPATIVYRNHGLLEAMARGVVPIISAVEAARDIVEDGVSGIVAQHSEDGLLVAMRRAHALGEPAWRLMSAAAASVARERFGIPPWCATLRARYRELGRDES